MSEILHVGAEGWCEVRTVSSKESFTLRLKFDQHTLLLDRLGDECDLPPTNVAYKPGPNEMIGAQSPSEGWQRGYVLSTQENMCIVAMIDIGKTEKMIKNVLKLPKQLKEIPILGVTASVTKFFANEIIFSEKYLIGHLFKYIIKSQSDKGFTAELLFIKNNMQACEVTLEQWTPRFEDQGLKCPILEENALVEVLSYTDTRGLFVRPCDDRSVAMWHSVWQQVGAHCITAPDLMRVPVKGELLACRYSKEGTYYRALVLEVEDDDILVSYIDFGNKEHVTQDKLKPISQKLKEIPCMAVFVELTNVRTEYPNFSAKRYLDKIVVKSNIVFRVKLKEGLPFDLELRDKTTTLSEVLNKYLVPSWKLAVQEGRNPAVATLLSDNLLDMVLPTHQQLELTVLHVQSGNTLWACPFDSATSHYVLTQMSDDIAEYCAAIPNTTYLPRIYELCLVQYDGKWLRGVCRAYIELVVFVHLVDYGQSIVVNASSIRKMCDDFVSQQAIGIACIIEGLPEQPSEKLMARIRELIPNFSNHRVQVTRIADDFHYIEMFDVWLKLKREGLLETEP